MLLSWPSVFPGLNHIALAVKSLRAKIRDNSQLALVQGAADVVVASTATLERLLVADPEEKRR